MNVRLSIQSIRIIPLIMSLTELEQWELTLRKALDEVDTELEKRFSDKISRHPCRPAAGTTSSTKSDGLFAVASAFSLGLTTGSGPGYTISIRVSSSLPLTSEENENILAEAAELIPEALSKAFPERQFTLERIGDNFRLSGDLSL